jgi:hypothetical protein
MAKIKLTKTVVDAAQRQTCDLELRDTLVPGFLCKVTPTGHKVFMLQYRTNSGVRRSRPPPGTGKGGRMTGHRMPFHPPGWSCRRDARIQPWQSIPVSGIVRRSR